MSHINLPQYLFFTDETRHPEIEDVLSIASKLHNNDAIVFRHYTHTHRTKFARIVQKFCAVKGVKFIIAGDIKLAIELDACGIHLPEWLAAKPLNDLSEITCWAKNEGKILTAAAHSFEAIEIAYNIKVDAVVASPIFPTISHPNANVVGEQQFKKWCNKSPCPLYALGGINKENENKLRDENNNYITKIIGIASSGTFWD